MVDNLQCVVAQCTLEAGDVLYSDIKRPSLQSWNKLLQEAEIKQHHDQLLSDRFLIISSVEKTGVNSNVVDIEPHKSMRISNWFFSRTSE